MEADNYVIDYSNVSEVFKNYKHFLFKKQCALY